MTRTVWKFRLLMDNYGNVYKLELPKDAQVLSFGFQSESAYLWALVDPKAEKDYRTFKVVSTGQYINETDLVFVGTAFIGAYVFHLFEVLNA